LLTKYTVESGKISYIGVSEISAATLERACKVICPTHIAHMTLTVLFQKQVGKIAVAEIEVSPWSYEDETKKGSSSFVLVEHISNFKN
jgi:aryl-alcohol dehydrogenase-like predicted oxidoreductase